MDTKLTDKEEVRSKTNREPTDSFPFWIFPVCFVNSHNVQLLRTYPYMQPDTINVFVT